MSDKEAISSPAETTGTPGQIPPAIRLVAAFKDSVQASRALSDPAEEALDVENLIIAADASFEALGRYADLVHALRCGDLGPEANQDDSSVEGGYDNWYDAASVLLDRVRWLWRIEYECRGDKTLAGHHRSARDVMDEFQLRREADKGALSTGRLSALALKLASARSSLTAAGDHP